MLPGTHGESKGRNHGKGNGGHENSDHQEFPLFLLGEHRVPHQTKIT